MLYYWFQYIIKHSTLVVFVSCQILLSRIQTNSRKTMCDYYYYYYFENELMFNVAHNRILQYPFIYSLKQQVRLGTQEKSVSPSLLAVLIINSNGNACYRDWALVVGQHWKSHNHSTPWREHYNWKIVLTIQVTIGRNATFRPKTKYVSVLSHAKIN